jgi:hypothetical protein
MTPVNEGRPIDRMDEFPESIKSRFRGRSVPSPQAKQVRVEPEKIIVENHVIPFNFDSILYPDGQALILIATSDLVLDTWRIKIDKLEKDTNLSLIAKTDLDLHLYKFEELKEGSNKPDSDKGRINFVILEGEELYIRSDKPINLTITLEFLRHGRTADRIIPVHR